MPSEEVFLVSETEWKWKQMSKNEVFVLKAKVCTHRTSRGYFASTSIPVQIKEKLKWIKSNGKINMPSFCSSVWYLRNELTHIVISLQVVKVRRLVTKYDFHSKQWLTWSTSKYLCVEKRQKFGFNGNRMKFCISCLHFQNHKFKPHHERFLQVLSSVVSWMDGSALISCAPTCRVTPL